jgi:purine-binding chemotaxis protein CheW
MEAGQEIAREKGHSSEVIGQPGQDRRLAGKYLTFKLGTESYGLQILKVQEIIGLMDITRVPRMPSYVRGVINLRGRVIPVLDLRLKFEMEAVDATEKTCIIVVQVKRKGEGVIMGVLVDEVSEVLDVDASQIEPTPAVGSETVQDFIMGMGKVGDQVVMLLDVDKALAAGEDLAAF